MTIKKQSPTVTVPAPRRSTRWLPVIWFTLFSLLGGASLWHAFRHDTPTASANATLASAASQPQPKYITQPIRDIQVGTWVLADNPETEIESDFDDVIPDEWRRLQFQLVKEDHSTLNVELLRPLWWMEQNAVTSPGDVVELNLVEMGAVGPAKLQAIEVCPDIALQPSPHHRLITGKFSHSTGNVIHVWIGGIDDPIAVTSTHPFWSDDRQAFVAALELRSGERLRQADGSIVYVSTVKETNRTEPVYNLEVDGEHVYYVTSTGILVHNAGCGPGTVVNVLESMSPKAAKYQKQVTGLGKGKAYWVNGTKFDGYKKGVLIDAKGPGYSSLTNRPDVAPQLAKKLLGQAERQIGAANGTPIRWVVAEKDFAQKLRYLFNRKGINIDVVHQAMR